MDIHIISGELNACCAPVTMDTFAMETANHRLPPAICKAWFGFWKDTTRREIKCSVCQEGQYHWEFTGVIWRIVFDC